MSIESMSVELKPCPFCGSDEIRTVVDDGIGWEKCTKCSSTGPIFSKYTGADDQECVTWNARIESEVLATPSAGAVPSIAEQITKNMQEIPTAVKEDLRQQAEAVSRLGGVVYNKDVPATATSPIDGRGKGVVSDDALEDAETFLLDKLGFIYDHRGCFKSRATLLAVNEVREITKAFVALLTTPPNQAQEESTARRILPFGEDADAEAEAISAIEGETWTCLKCGSGIRNWHRTLPNGSECPNKTRIKG